MLLERKSLLDSHKFFVRFYVEFYNVTLLLLSVSNHIYKDLFVIKSDHRLYSYFNCSYLRPMIAKLTS